MSQTPPEGLPDDMPPPPEGGMPFPEPAVAEAAVASGDPLRRRKPGLWDRIGGQGLMASLLFHGGLLLLFAAWVIVTITDEAKTDPDTFATGAGGGSKGERAVIRDHKVTPKNAQAIARTSPRITSKSSTAAVALPDLPTTSVSSLLTGMTAGGSSKGFGGGSGGGIGSGQGIGVGNARNFVGKPVMGARIAASKIAVYLDASGSMVGYLPEVIEQIQRQFPDADFFSHNGCFLFVHDAKVVGGRRSRLDEPVGLWGGVDPRYETKVDKLSSQGKAVFRRFDSHFRKGGLGAWLDVMLGEKYDAIIVFADFQDGLTQTAGADKGIIYSDGVGRPKVDQRKDRDTRWEAQWVEAFAGAQSGKAPRLYLFSTSVVPQPILQKCVEASAGEVKMVTWLRSMPEAMMVLRANPAFSRGEFSAANFAAQTEASRPGFRKAANGQPLAVRPETLLNVLVEADRIRKLDNGNYVLSGATATPVAGSSGSGARPAR